MKIVIIKPKLIVILISPRISFPKNLATKKLNETGTNPTNKRAIPV